MFETIARIFLFIFGIVACVIGAACFYLSLGK